MASSAALGKGGHSVTRVRPAGAWLTAEELAHPGLQTARGVLQGEVEHRAAIDGHGVERLASGRDGQAEPEGQPGLADLGRSGEQADAFGEDAGHGPFRLGERRGHELVGGPRGLRTLGHRVQARSGSVHAATCRGRLAPARRPEAMVRRASRSLGR